MIVFCTIFFAILIFPLYISVDGYYNKEIKKLFLNVNLFKMLKLFGGYFGFYKEGFAFHLSEKKAILFPYTSFFGIKEKIKPLKDYHVKKINVRLDIGTENNSSFPIILSSLYACHNNIFGSILSQIKPYLNYKNNLNIIEKNNQFTVYVEVTTILNLFMILISLIKISMEKIFYAFNRQ